MFLSSGNRVNVLVSSGRPPAFHGRSCHALHQITASLIVNRSWLCQGNSDDAFKKIQNKKDREMEIDLLRICFMPYKSIPESGINKYFFLSLFTMLVSSLQYGRASYICWVMIYGICEMRTGKLFKQMQCGPEKHRSDGLYHRQNESLWIRLESFPHILQPNAILSPDFALWVTKGKPQSGKILSGRKLQRKNRTHPNISS